MVVGFECRFEGHQGLGFLEKPVLIDKKMESQSNGGLFFGILVLRVARLQVCDFKFFGARILDLWGGVHECAQHEGTDPGAQLLFLSR
jgi:hypothetical protein